ncbi:MAG TPA: trypsin-like peptidase domain-containing protein [Burkholderiales bacterium]|nr:trypsin-like peptidase domain-containing protein [Burkholderiales bacterium]
MARALVLVAALLAGCSALRPDFTAVVQSEGAAVVAIAAGSAAPSAEESPGEDEEPLAPLPEGPLFGSGFLVSADGYVVTNAHLVEQAPDEITVRLTDRREFKAVLVGSDAMTDIALVKIAARGLPHVRIGDSRKLQPGEWVAAIGSPFGLERSVTAGIVSATGRTLPEEGYVPFIQTDVAVNPGNSGGPLFNLAGEVIGVNSVIYSASGGFVGVSFAVPIEVAMDVVRELRAYGRVTRGRIGVRLQELTGDLAAALHVPGGEGALVLDVLRDGPAERAGLRSGDVVVRFGGKRVHDHSDLMRLASEAHPDELVLVDFVRDGKPMRAYVTVAEARVAPPARRPAPLGEPLGLVLAPSPEGLLVKRAEGAAQRAGIESGDLILAVNGSAVLTPAEFDAALARVTKGARVALLVQREGLRRFVAVRLPD